MMRASVALLIGIITTALFGCEWGIATDPGISEGIEAINETNDTLHFVVIVADEEHRLTAEIPPGQGQLVLSGSAIGPGSLVVRDGCTTGDLVALGPGEQEIARHSPPLCLGDVWVIEESASRPDDS